MKTASKRRSAAKPSAEIRVTSLMGTRHVVADVKEPSGKVQQWILDVSLTPEVARPKEQVTFKLGDHVLYTEAVMPQPFKVPFYKLVAAKKRGKARRAL